MNLIAVETQLRRESSPWKVCRCCGTSANRRTRQKHSRSPATNLKPRPKTEVGGSLTRFARCQDALRTLQFSCGAGRVVTPESGSDDPAAHKKARNDGLLSSRLQCIGDEMIGSGWSPDRNPLAEFPANREINREYQLFGNCLGCAASKALQMVDLNQWLDAYFPMQQNSE